MLNKPADTKESNANNFMISPVKNDFESSGDLIILQNVAQVKPKYQMDSIIQQDSLNSASKESIGSILRDSSDLNTIPSHVTGR